MEKERLRLSPGNQMWYENGLQKEPILPMRSFLLHSWPYVALLHHNNQFSPLLLSVDKRWGGKKQFAAISQFGLIMLLWLVGLAFSAPAQVNVSVSPTTVSNTYVGYLTYTITGLTNGEMVLVQKFLDVNTNGVIDGQDLLVKQGKWTDGRVMAFDGVTNLNVSGDMDSTPGQITAQVLFQTAFSYRNVWQSLIGNYLTRVSSLTGRFPALTNSLTVTDANFAQSFTGKVQNNGTNMPYALVLLMNATNGDGMAGTVTDSNGNYTLTAPPGYYQLVAGKSNFVCNMTTLPSAILNAGATITTNLTLIAATQSISGMVVDSLTANGLGGQFLSASDKTIGEVAFASTDTNGNFTLSANASSQWQIKADVMGLATIDYLRLQTSYSPVVDTTTGSVSGVTMALPLGAAIIYGTVKDDQNHPIPGLRLWFEGTSNPYETAVVTDPNGHYYASGLAGGWNAWFDTDVPLLANYSWPANYVAVTATNLQATELNFVLPILGEPVVSQPVNLSGGRFGFNLAGLIGTNYVVQASTNLATTNWFTVLTTNLTASPVFIQDNHATNLQRYYRVVKQ